MDGPQLQHSVDIPGGAGVNGDSGSRAPRVGFRGSGQLGLYGDFAGRSRVLPPLAATVPAASSPSGPARVRAHFTPEESGVLATSSTFSEIG